MDINSLNESELNDLSLMISKRITQIKLDKEEEAKRKASTKNKIKLSQLTENDRIFAIGIAWNNKTDAGTLIDNETKWNVYLMDWCEVTVSIPAKTPLDLNRIGFSHKTRPFGINTAVDNESYEKGYYLDLGVFTTGYGGFYTLSPSTWEIDILDAYDKVIEIHNRSHNNTISRLKGKLSVFFNEKEFIYNKIKEL